MVEVKYKGEKTDLGRFGTVKKGDILTMTDHEYATATDLPEKAKRFQRLTSQEKEAEQQRIAEEAARRAQEAQDQENLPDEAEPENTEPENARTRKQEIDEMTKEELLEYKNKLEAEGMDFTGIGKNTSRDNLANHIKKLTGVAEH